MAALLFTRSTQGTEGSLEGGSMAAKLYVRGAEGAEGASMAAILDIRGAEGAK